MSRRGAPPLPLNKPSDEFLSWQVPRMGTYAHHSNGPNPSVDTAVHLSQFWDGGAGLALCHLPAMSPKGSGLSSPESWASPALWMRG